MLGELIISTKKGVIKIKDYLIVHKINSYIFKLYEDNDPQNALNRHKSIKESIKIGEVCLYRRLDMEEKNEEL